MPISTEIFNNRLMVHLKNEDLFDVWKVLGEMNDLSLKPNEKTFHYLFECCAIKGEERLLK